MAPQTDPFPAVLIGGPPHSGKSVLVYSLTQALRERRVAHYVLRACPDGEGDWANEAEQQLVQELRSKGSYSREFMNRVGEYLQDRHLPLLVDVGGKPTPWQAAVFAHCTHAVLLIAGDPDDPGAFRRRRAWWRELMAEQGAPIIAELRSRLTGEDEVTGVSPLLTGTITGLERGRRAAGPAFTALVDRLEALFSYEEGELVKRHLAGAPAAARTINLPTWTRRLGSEDYRWEPEQLPALKAAVPPHSPLALYGRGPNWVYATLAAHALPAPVWLFDARLGWTPPPTLPMLAPGETWPPAQPGWRVTLRRQGEHDVLEMETASQYLLIDAIDRLPIYQPLPGRNLILSGKIPHWLLAAAVRQLAPDSRQIAVYHPPTRGSVIVYVGEGALATVGDLIPGVRHKKVARDALTAADVLKSET
jgi:CRISPR-associated protein Csx3